jgi:putative MATE family efflux protein
MTAADPQPVAVDPAGQPQMQPAFSAATLDRHVWKLAIPSIAENLLQTALMIIDTLMISYYGSVPVAAATTAGIILWRTHMVLGCIDRGTTAMVARFSGEGNHELVARTIAQSTWLALLIGAIQTSAGLVFAPQMLTALGTSEEVTAAATPYLRAIFVASGARMFFFVAAAALRGVGDTRTPMWITLWMNVLHVVANYALIFGHWGFPELRLLGSGVSTAVSLFFAAGAVAWVMFGGRTAFRIRPSHFGLDLPIMRTILRISFPAFLEEILISVGWLIFFSYIARMGTAVLAAHGIASRIESVSYMAGYGFSIAAATMVGQALGMDSVRLARKAFRRTTRYCVIVMSLIAIVLILFADQLIQAFHPTPEVREIGRVLLLIAAIEQPLLGICMTLWGGLRGAGDTLSPMLGSFVGTIVIRVFVVYWLAFTLGLGIYGVYIGTLIDWAIRALLLFAFYFHGRWSRLELHPHAEEQANAAPPETE